MILLHIYSRVDELIVRSGNLAPSIRYVLDMGMLLHGGGGGGEEGSVNSKSTSYSCNTYERASKQ